MLLKGDNLRSPASLDFPYTDKGWVYLPPYKACIKSIENIIGGNMYHSRIIRKQASFSIFTAVEFTF